jgi:hypothetical protein
MQTSIPVLRALHAREDGLVLVKLLLLDRNVDLDDVLPHNTACADVEMTTDARSVTNMDASDVTADEPDLGVAHKAVGKPDGESVRGERAMRVVLRDRVHVRGIAGVDGVALHALLGREAPAVMDAVRS